MGGSWFFLTETGKKGALSPGQLATGRSLRRLFFLHSRERFKHLESVLTIVGWEGLMPAKNSLKTRADLIASKVSSLVSCQEYEVMQQVAHGWHGPLPLLFACCGIGRWPDAIAPFRCWVPWPMGAGLRTALPSITTAGAEVAMRIVLGSFAFGLASVFSYGALFEETRTSQSIRITWPRWGWCLAQFWDLYQTNKLDVSRAAPCVCR